MMRNVLIMFILCVGTIQLCGAAEPSGERWISSKYVVDGHVDTGSGRQALAVRSGPGSDFSIAGSLNYGSPVAVYAERNGWLRISPTQSIVKTIPPKNGKGERWIRAQFVKNGVVDTGESRSALNARSGPGSTFPIVSALKSKEEVTVFEERNGWLRLPSKAGVESWVASQYITYTKEGRVDTGVSGAVLNVRSGPGDEFSLVEALSHGDIVTVSAVTNGWFCISPLPEVVEAAPVVVPKASEPIQVNSGLLSLIYGSCGLFLLLLLREA